MGVLLVSVAVPFANTCIGAVLVHGASASSNSMHTLAQAFAAAGLGVYALDIRGHGESGAKGHIAYVRQLECDLEDFATAALPQLPVTLVGFSSGGGFVLRIASSKQRAMFANCLLMAPFLGQHAPTSRPNSGGRVRVGVPRLVGVMMFKAVGIRLFDRLPFTRFALSDEAKDVPVTMVPGVGHIPLTLTPAGTRAAVAAVLATNA